MPNRKIQFLNDFFSSQLLEFYCSFLSKHNFNTNNDLKLCLNFLEKNFTLPCELFCLDVKTNKIEFSSVWQTEDNNKLLKELERFFIPPVYSFCFLGFEEYLFINTKKINTKDNLYLGILFNQGAIKDIINLFKTQFELFNRIFDIIDNPLFIVDTDNFNILHKNSAARNYLKARNQSRIILDEDVIAHIKEVQEFGNAKIYEINEIFNGKIIYFECEYKPISNLNMVFIQLRDISKQIIQEKEHSLHLNFLQNFLGDANIGFLIFNASGKLKKVNQKAKELLFIQKIDKNADINEIFEPFVDQMEEDEYSFLIQNSVNDGRVRVFYLNSSEYSLQITRKEIISGTSKNIALIIEDFSDFVFKNRTLEYENKFFSILSASSTELYSQKSLSAYSQNLIKILNKIYASFNFSYIFYDFNKKQLSYKLHQELHKKISGNVLSIDEVLAILMQKENQTIFEFTFYDIFPKLNKVDLMFLKSKYAFSSNFLHKNKSPYFNFFIFYKQDENPLIRNFLYSFYLLVKNALHNLIDKLIAVEEKKLAQKLSDAKSEYVSNISHEIKNPLSSLLGFAKILERNLKDQPKFKRQANIIKKSGEHIHQIIQDISDMTKIEANKLNVFIEKSSLNSLMDEIKDMYSNYFDENPNSKLELKIESPKREIEANTDPLRLKQIILNFISNALKYTDKGVIKVGLVEDDDWVEFYVSDTGKGIKKEDVASIFNRYERGNYQNDSTKEGVGIGLSISKEIAEKLGAKIKVDSELGKGSKFSIFVNKSEPTTIKDNLPLEKKLESKFILVLEDDENSCFFINYLFKSMDLNFTIVHNGIEGEAILKDKIPDIIFSDLWMPQKDGFDFIKDNNEMLKDTKTYVLTADTSPETKQKVLSLGVIDVIYKPVNPLRLKKVLRDNGILVKVGVK